VSTPGRARAASLQLQPYEKSLEDPIKPAKRIWNTKCPLICNEVQRG
jgi:hypothetical protein